MYAKDSVEASPKAIVDEWPVKRIVKYLGLIVVGLLFLFGGWATVGAGNRGVRVHFGEPIPGVLTEGFHFKWPLSDSIYNVEVRERKIEEPSAACSKDLQNVHTTIALNYHVIPDMAYNIFREIGPAYEERVIQPAMHEALKAVTAQFTAEELVVQRETVRAKVEDLLRKRLQEVYLYLDKVSIVDFKFSEQFTKSIEDKQTAEQDALRAMHELRKKKTDYEQIVAKAEAEQRSRVAQAKGIAEATILEAEGSAKAIQIRAEAEASAHKLLSSSATNASLEARAIERWDGALPKVNASGAVPFIDLMDAAKTEKAK